ncbi:hypothetical protein HRR83_005136 [Exophiala dermatitidis]|uniref:F-box domain-containing protein n=1 Tax=Exophiala dermatitidis TaxID=5970 RepID=A0AAN6EXF5_EXODE|nr:hypothetical protein HRR75_004298 [Exophiala dermatitidis]KAJ4516950.1 hypothetical protein HRR74_004699 [Exophiala dermatitidis]KAJ4519871.1 hypothetical protein HRR73_003932 [Exophiala dermatitidis]KAJ4534320.1 hypothetical protein HRR76_006248 [Exophiala dermatitidis]KAJ4541458.1 hypothetical protein HRR77_006250 [Exophiala dermatitidis]
MESGVLNQDGPQMANDNGPQILLAKHLNGKKSEWDAITAQKEPLRLLDLPVDILQAILKEVIHTNDLTSLALTHSALHALVIPHIYSRFDIVWPDANATFENRVGVDALTYGLATLVMAHDVFGEAPYQQQSQHHCSHCGHSNPQPNRPRRIRRGNYFAQYTRKFSLGNGPADWVQEYLITKEGGKMLGTLVALAVGRMRNLEAFIWDMPTGVLRDVWLALASLGNRDDGQECRLERVWVRWHDNQNDGPLTSPHPAIAPGPQTPNIPTILANSMHSLFQIPPYPRVEFPTFSILPPLRSLSVLDIDELPYAEEMSVLIERSLGRLKELRVGMSANAQFDIWALPSEERAPDLSSIMSGLSDQAPRPGGILGVLVHRFCNAFSPQPSSIISVQVQKHTGGMPVEADYTPHHQRIDEAGTLVNPSEIDQLGLLFSAHSIHNSDDVQTHDQDPMSKRSPPLTQPQAHKPHHAQRIGHPLHPSGRDSAPSRKLQLESFECERVFLSIPVLSQAIDWSRLTTLTLLGCRNHEQLWRALRKRFTPMSRRRVSSANFKTPSNANIFANPSAYGHATTNASTPTSAPAASEYTLKLKRLHTDTVSPSLIAFIRDTLAPDSLEWLFLQRNPAYKPPVTIEMIYKGAIRRHRSSLRKLLIDSTLRLDNPGSPDASPRSNWRRWVANRELITCITSGKMKLRELSMSIDYKDWHYFLRRLPYATTLRSMHIPHIVGYVHGTVHPREAALQVLDIVALRPELELCYLGVENQCFEILEYAEAPRKASRSGLDSNVASGGFPGSGMVQHSGDDIETDAHVGPAGGGGGGFVDHHHHTQLHNLPHSHAHQHQHVHHADDQGGEDGHGGGGDDEGGHESANSSDLEALSDPGEGISDDEDSDESDDQGADGDRGGGGGGSSNRRTKRTWRLREILFYDDKISIFKARHGRL